MSASDQCVPKITRRASRFPFAAVALALGTSLLLTPSALASARGFESWGGFGVTIGGQAIKIPAGQLYGVVEGDGLRIDMTSGGFGTYSSSICNWHIQVDFIDEHEKTYAWYRQPTQESCDAKGAYKIDAGGWTAKPGQACIRLYTNFENHVASVCHSIHK